MDDGEVATAQDLCEYFVQFFTTNHCLTWIESGIIVNYAGGWGELLGNAVKVLEAVDASPISKHEFFEH